MRTLKYFSNTFNFLFAHKTLKKTGLKRCSEILKLYLLLLWVAQTAKNEAYRPTVVKNWVHSVERAELLSSLLLFTGGVEIKVTLKNSPQKAAQFRLFYASQGALTMHKLWPLSRNLTWKMNKITP